MRTTDLQEPERLAYGAGEAAQLLGYSRNGFAALLNAGLIPSFRQGRRRLVRRSDLVDFMQREIAKSRQQASSESRGV